MQCQLSLFWCWMKVIRDDVQNSLPVYLTFPMNFSIFCLNIEFWKTNNFCVNIFYLILMKKMMNIFHCHCKVVIKYIFIYNVHIIIIYDLWYINLCAMKVIFIKKISKNILPTANHANIFFYILLEFVAFQIRHQNIVVY